MSAVESVFAACAQAFTGIVFDIGPGAGEYAAIAKRVNKANATYVMDAGSSAAPHRHASRVTLVKLHDEPQAALDALQPLLKTHRPVVFYDVGNQTNVRSLDTMRRRANYIDVQLHDAQGVIGAPVQWEPTSTRHLLVPFEKLARVAQLLHAAGYALRDPDGATIDVEGVDEVG